VKESHTQKLASPIVALFASHAYACLCSGEGQERSVLEREHRLGKACRRWGGARPPEKPWMWAQTAGA